MDMIHSMDRSAYVFMFLCQGGELPFHILLLMGLLFGVLKVMSYKIPILWVHVCLLQFSNAGLWQTIRFANRGRNLEKASTTEM
jgi:hypothetical protein